MDEIRVTGTTVDAIREMLSDDVAAQDFLKASFLSAAMTTLFYARRKAELTQAQVAERMGTKQSAIARMEADASGSTSLRRYVEYALTCDVIPFDITLIQASALKDYARTEPSAPRTEAAYQAWHADGGAGEQPPANEDELGSRLSDDLLAQALEQAQATDDDRLRALIVEMAAPSLDARASNLVNLVNKALEIVRSIKDEDLRLDASLALQRPGIKSVIAAHASIEEELGLANALQQDPAPEFRGLQAFIEEHSEPEPAPTPSECRVQPRPLTVAELIDRFSGPEPVPTPEEMQDIVREGILAEARAEYGDLLEE